jgi:hypothetical protein
MRHASWYQEGIGEGQKNQDLRVRNTGDVLGCHPLEQNGAFTDERLWCTEKVTLPCIAMTKYLGKPAPGRNYLFWLTVSEVSAHHGREDVAEQHRSHHGSRKQRCPLWLTFYFPFYSIPVGSSLRGGAAHIQGKLAPHLVNPVWKCPHRCTQRCALLIC